MFNSKETAHFDSIRVPLYFDWCALPSESEENEDDNDDAPVVAFFTFSK
jgi:hypothetical protein